MINSASDNTNENLICQCIKDHPTSEYNLFNLHKIGNPREKFNGTIGFNKAPVCYKINSNAKWHNTY